VKTLIVGAGVIGTVYGYALAQAGNDVTHYVRPGKKAALEQGVHMRLLDGHEQKPIDREVTYNLKVVGSLSPHDDYELFIVSVRHYQLDGVLPLLKANLGQADLLLFNGNWAGLETVDQVFPRSKYLWGFPVAGGGYQGEKLDAALLDEIRLGEIDGSRTPRLQRISEMFEQAQLKVDVQSNMLHWLWVHFAINCGIIGAAFKAGAPRNS